MISAEVYSTYSSSMWAPNALAFVRNDLSFRDQTNQIRFSLAVWSNVGKEIAHSLYAILDSTLHPIVLLNLYAQNLPFKRLYGTTPRNRRLHASHSSRLKQNKFY